jgi:protein SCO1/2
VKRALIALAGMLSLGLVACTPAPTPPRFQATDITGAPFAHDFRLTDHTGQMRTLADFKGKAVAVFFGYTHCPDVCPTTLADFAAALKMLGSQGDRVQVIFVTVDPERDTPEVLRQFVPAFDPRFLGMYTDAASLRLLAKDYKIVYQKTAQKNPDDYLIDHSAGTYIYDPKGRLRLLMPYGSKPEAIAQDLKTLLASP